MKPDFLSWHGYLSDPTKFNREAVEGRKLCAEYGLTNCELIINEWHYFGLEDYNWDEIQRCSDPKIKEKIWEGPRGHNGTHSAAFSLALLANLQRSELDQAYFYGCRHTGNWGWKDEYQKKYKVFYALKLFGDLVKKYPVICEGENADGVTALAVKSADGKRQALLLVDYVEKRESAAELRAKVRGLRAGAKAKATVLDHAHDLASWAVETEGEEIVVRKADGNSASYLVEWE